jgi:hypothetical protein
MNATMTDIVSLDEVLAYRHPGVIRRYAKEQQVALEEAQEVFQETLKWLYLCATGIRAGLSCAMTPEIGQLDEMWHTFVLFTRDYADFCERNFGFFVHHVPTEAEEEAGPVDLKKVREQLEQQYGLVYDVLGEDTLRRWYDEDRYAAAA